jgi:hypothetical protein
MREVMPRQSAIADQILDAVRLTPGCPLDELVVSFPSATWKQVFLEVARLSRIGRVQVTVGAENCTVRLQEKGSPNPDPSTNLSSDEMFPPSHPQ